MRVALRIAAVAIAIAGLVDPAIARRVQAPLSVRFRLPAPSHPDFSRAEALRRDLGSAIQEIATVDGAAAPHAIVAIGDAEIGDVEGARVFSMPLADRRPSASMIATSVPRRTVLGQNAVVTARVRGLGLVGRTSAFNLQLRGASIATVEHTWAKEDEEFEARFSFPPAGPGVHRVRIEARTAGLPEPAVADAVIVVGAEPLRILVFESRPSWPVTFVRRSLEADALFDVASAVRSSRPVVTLSDRAPASLRALDVERYDALVVGSLDELRDPDFDALDRFVTGRGGTLILLPDRRVPETIRRRFDLPALDEALLEKPVDANGHVGALKASELLLPPPGLDGMHSLAEVQHGQSDRPVVMSFERGAGRIVFSGALDAWRYRASTGFDAFWRSLIADAALAAPPKLDVVVEPALAHPGDAVKVTVDVRATEVAQDGSARGVPPISARLTSDGGSDGPIRLWPSTRVGTFEARLRAPAARRYTVAVSAAGTSTSAPWLIADDVVHATRPVDRAAAHAAHATGGAVLSDPGDIARALSAIETGTEERSTHPMRSPWWIGPFSLLLCAEWSLRRRSGLK